MKRMIAFALTLAVCLLAGCQQAEKPGETTPVAAFSVGYGQESISPDHSVYLCGYNDPKEERMSTMVAEALYATCVAFSDEDGNTVILLSLDLLLANKTVVGIVQDQISKETGVPVEQILYHTTHNHTGPDYSDPVYRQKVISACSKAAKDAMADRKPAQMYTTYTRPEGINTVRHYLLADGTYMGEGLGAVATEMLVGHYGKADNLLQLVKFTREGAKDIVMINWQGHPRGPTPNPYTAATSNYPGVMRTTVETGLDCHSIFILSGSGNVNNNSKIPGEVNYENYMELGKGLGQIAIDAAASFAPAETGKILFTKTGLDAMGNESPDGEVKLYAFSMGDLAFAAAPFEIFDTNAMAVRDNSKYKMTFYASCTNAYYSYLPTPPSFAWEQHYEVRVTKYPEGTAENVEQALIGLLDNIFAQSGAAEKEKGEGYITPEFVPASDGVEYMNLTPGDTTAYTEVKNGFYQLVMMPTGASTPKMMLAASEEVAKKVLEQTTTKLVFNEQNVIVDIAQ